MFGDKYSQTMPLDNVDPSYQLCHGGGHGGRMSGKYLNGMLGEHSGTFLSGAMLFAWL